MPWNPEQGVGKKEKKWLRALYALPLLAVLYGANTIMGAVGDEVLPYIISVAKSGADVIDLDNGLTVPLLKKYFGIPAVDNFFRIFVAAFTPAIGGFDPLTKAQGLLFLADLIPFQTIWMVESYRRGNFMTPAHLLPVLMGVLFQLKGVGIIAPIYYFLHYVCSPLENYSAADNRMVQMGPLKTIIPTVTLTYILPSLAMARVGDLESAQWINAVVWQAFPVYAAILQRLFSLVVKDTTEQDRMTNPEADMPTLRRVYAFSGGIAALAYTYIRFMTPISITSALFTNIREPWAPVTVLTGMSKFFRYDQICCFGATFIWILLNFIDLKRANKLSAGWPKILGVFAGTALVAGPGAAMAAMWAWREECLVPKRAPVAAKNK